MIGSAYQHSTVIFLHNIPHDLNAQAGTLMFLRVVPAIVQLHNAIIGIPDVDSNVE